METVSRLRREGKNDVVRRVELKKYGAYFDESANFDKDTEKRTELFTIALIKESKKPVIRKHLRRLMSEMTREFKRVAPALDGFGVLAPGKLLEIHAVDLYQSRGPYKKIKDYDPDFWHVQHKWLERTLQIGAEFEVEYICNSYSDEVLKAVKLVGLAHGDSFTENLKYKKVKEKVKSILTDPYFYALPIVLDELNNILINRNAEANIVCHTMDKAKSFSILDSFKVVKREGHFVSIGNPDFKTCTEEPLLQLADVASYIYLQQRQSIYLNRNMKPYFQDLYQKYVRPRSIYSEDHKKLFNPHPVTRMLIELIAIDCGGPLYMQNAIKATLPYVLENMATEQFRHRALLITEEGIIFRP